MTICGFRWRKFVADMRMSEAVRLFNYVDGRLFHKTGPCQGLEAGTLLKSGYVQLAVNGRFYRAHRVIWAMHYDVVPEFIDHINRNRADNRLENLRPASKAENAQNRGITSMNSSGVIGVSPCRRTGKWQAQIKCMGVHRHLGRFDTVVEAEAAYRHAKSELHKFQPILM